MWLLFLTKKKNLKEQEKEKNNFFIHNFYTMFVETIQDEFK